ncbi:hypothetical protein YC2023_094842 [Brassica napus]
MFEDSRSDIFQTDLVVGWFFRDSSHESSISVVGSSLHHDEAVIRSCWRVLWYIYDHNLSKLGSKISTQILYTYRYDCSLSIMADNLRRAIQDLSLGIDDAPVTLSAAVCSEARRVNQFSLMGRPTMQTKQNIRALLTSLPKMWGIPGLITGRLVERRKFQFVFPTEEMLSSVLERGPWAFNDRMLVVSRWNAGMDDQNLNHIPFWVQIRGIPLEYLSEPVIRDIGDRMGEVMKVDFKPEVNAAVEFVRVRINWNVANPLKFKRNFQFSPGINTLLQFRYERLKGFCDQCDHGDMEIPEQQDAPVLPAQSNQNPVRGSASGSFVALMQNFWSDAPMVEMQQEYERRVGAVRMKRQKEFVTTVVEGQVQGQLEVASEEDEDHAILEWEARRYDDVDIRQYGSFLQDDQTMEVSDTCLGKRSREELNEESIDKFPVGKMRMSAEFNALRQLQEDYGQDQEHDHISMIDRGAVGPVPPDAP